MHPDIRHILEAATLAPSGENTQPWKFVVKNFEIEAWNVHERDQSIYNWGQRASYMANGAALENLIIAAKEFGYSAEVSLFPNIQQEHLVARILLTPTKTAKDPLYSYISKRVTNRKAYKDTILKTSILSELESAKEPGTCVRLTQDAHHKRSLGRVGSTNEEIMLSNKHLHQFFFSHINWNKAEDDAKKIGFFIDTLELAPPARASFSLLKHWPIMSFFNKLNFHKVVGKQNAAINASSAGFGCITLSDMEPKSFVQAGRTLERVWLTATKHGLSLQPLTGVLFFMYRVMASDTEKFTHSQVESIKKAYNEMKLAFGINNNETIAFMFRIGESEAPTARSSRFSVDEVTEVIQ